MINPATARIARSAAIAIAVLAAIDPAITVDRAVRREVALVAADTTRDRDALDRTARALEGQFTVLHAPFSGAAATVIVGDALPAVAPTGPLFAVTSDTTRPQLRIVAVGAPELAPLASRVRVPVRLRASAVGGRTLGISLEVGGVVVDRVEKAITSPGEFVDTALSFVPSAVGLVTLRVAARAGDASDVADAVVDVRNTRWPVLFFDPRPSWLSTFVRRAVENDERFSVVSRVVTSRNVSRDAGQPPASLADVGGGDLERYDVVVVGAAQSLTDAQIAGLERFLNARGGRVVLLFDERAAGPVDRLIGVRAWASSTDSPAVVATTGGGADQAFRASEFAWPVSLPAGATAIAKARVGGADRPAIWTTPADGEGGGEITVSGAHDSWRFRDDSAGSFDRAWRDLIATAAAGATGALAVEITPRAPRPGQMIDVRVRSRDAALSVASGRSATAVVAANLVDSSGAETIRLWPTGLAGELAGRVRAPPTAADAQIVATLGTTTRTISLATADTVHRAAPDQRHLLQELARASGGAVVSGDRLDELAAGLQRALGPSHRREPWHPMRSPWWIAPFALLLGAEWWWRRRSGLV